MRTYGHAISHFQPEHLTGMIWLSVVVGATEMQLLLLSACKAGVSLSNEYAFPLKFC